MTSDLRLSRVEYGFAQFMSVMASAPAKLEEKPKGRTRQTQDRAQEPHSRSMPFRNEIGSEMVDIYVGPEEEPFRVHKQKLCQRIPYFDKMFNGRFREASENVGRLPEDDPAAFDVLMEWVYCHNIRHIRDMVHNADSEGESGPSWDAVEVYSMAEKFCLPELQDTIMNVLVRFHRSRDELPSPDFVHRAYSRTSAGSSLSRYCARAIFYVLGEGIQDGWPTTELQKLFQDHSAFAFDYITLQRTARPSDPATLDRCIFHVHGKGEHCIDGSGRKRKFGKVVESESK